MGGCGWVGLCLCVCVCVCVCLRGCLRACVCVCMYVYTSARIHTTLLPITHSTITSHTPFSTVNSLYRNPFTRVMMGLQFALQRRCCAP